MVSSKIKPYMISYPGLLSIYTYATNQKKVILKLDFEKAFDTVEYYAIITMLRHLGSSDKFISWINNILTTASTSIVLNGVQGKNIICKRGVRQGDSLSPLLFVATAELLQIIINYAWHECIINLPIDSSYGQNYPIIQYADDTLLTVPANIEQLNNLKEILLNFSISTS
jgi:hypothetical protein